MASSSSYSFTVVLIVSITLLGFPSFSSSAIVERCFHVKNLTVNKLCRNQVITAVNGLFPGPALHVHEGDALAVTVVNMSPYNISIHW
ncbi:hypothetical protein M569_17119 [Genlisea aurea]|uniref:Plastocyanin-like domain-containing protein n=1 Tax=Genlisea aurea TaxID=192259 RepID=S8D4T0_9LAMI|nr:hypothetical protein M569_17119 [Genlisea aurea]